MSQENVDALRRVYDGLSTGDLSPLLELSDTNVELTEPPEIPDSSTVYGHDGVRGVMDKLQEVFPDMQFKAPTFVDNRDRVLVSMQWRGMGAGSGASGEATLFHVWTFEDGRVSRIQAFFDRDQALKAAGLSEAPELPPRTGKRGRSPGPARRDTAWAMSRPDLERRENS